MKKIKLTLFATLLSVVVGYAQSPRVTLYEEFSGENCPPCASLNPALWATIVANPTNCILVKYQSPIPSAGPIYNQFKPHTDARMSYYSVPFAPYGRGNGKVQGSGTNAGNISNFTQAEINAENAILSPFTINTSHTWSADGDSIYAVVTINCTQAYTGGSNTLKLRSALVEHLQYANAPGTNGETEFHNVMRQMYPDASGTTIGSNWTNGQTQTLTLAGKVPAYCDKGENMFLVVWIQNDSSKFVLQANKSTVLPLALDLSIEDVSSTPSLQCASANVNQGHTVTLKNKGTSTITNATINYRLDNGAYVSQVWTGSLVSGGTTTYTMPNVSAGGGSHIIVDSATNINGQPFEINPVNNLNGALFNIHNTTINNIPLAIDFENAGTVPTGVTLIDENANNQKWRVVSGTGNIGFNNSKYCIFHENYSYKLGEENVAILPTIDHAIAGAKGISFHFAYATYAAEADALDLVYSTNCGSSWTSIWNKTGVDLQTAPKTTSPFIPTQAQWAFGFVDITSIPANAIFGFKATSAYGNNLFIDNINIATPNAVSNLVNPSAIILSPNPSNSIVNVSAILPSVENVNLSLIDMTGKLLFSKSINNTNQIEEALNVANYAAGIYNLVIKTNSGSTTKKLTVTN